MASKELREQISVPVDPQTKAAIERAAKAEHRTMASWLRHLAARALENQEGVAA
jgi:uncharacterized protein (DUF1778 family)